MEDNASYSVPDLETFISPDYDINNIPIGWKKVMKEAGIKKKDLKDIETRKLVSKPTECLCLIHLKIYDLLKNHEQELTGEFEENEELMFGKESPVSSRSVSSHFVKRLRFTNRHLLISVTLTEPGPKTSSQRHSLMVSNSNPILHLNLVLTKNEEEKVDLF